MADLGSVIKIPIDFTPLTTGEAKLKAMQKEAKEARADIEKTKQAQTAAGQPINISTAQRNRLTAANTAINNFKADRKLEQQGRAEWQHMEEARVQRWHNAATMGAAARESAWDYALEAGAAARRGDAARSLVEQQGKAIIFNRNRAQIKADAAYAERTGQNKDPIDKLQNTMTRIHFAKHAVHSAEHVVNAFYHQDLEHFNVNPVAEELSRRNGLERVEERMHAIGQIARSIPIPGAQVVGEGIKLLGLAAGFAGGKERAELAQKENDRRNLVAFTNGGIRQHGDPGWNGLNRADLQRLKRVSTNDIIQSDTKAGVLAQIERTFGAGGGALLKLSPEVVAAIDARIQERVAKGKEIAGYAYEDAAAGNFGKAEHEMMMARKAFGEKGPYMWSAPDAYMAKVSSTEAANLWMRGQMKRAGNRTGD